MMRHQIFIISLIILAGCASPDGPRPTPDRATQSQLVDALFDQFTDQTQGCAVGVDYQGTVLHRAGYGMSDLEKNIPITPASVFYTGSVSKQVVAMSAMILVDQGKLDLDAPVGSYLPQLPAYADDITTRELLHHTSGIRDFFVLLRLAGRFDEVVITEAMIMDILAQQKGLNFTPGSQYAYSNSAYFLISQIVSALEGRNLDRFAQENIFDPLAMNDTLFQHDHKSPIADMAHGHTPNPNGGYIRADVTLDVVGSGGMYSNIDDLIRWDRNFYENKLLGGQGVIDQMQSTGRLNDGTATDYGFGLKLKPYRGLQQISHSGSLAGYRARLQRFPEHRLTVAILCNSSAAKPTKLANQITDIYLANYLAPASAKNKQQARQIIRPALEAPKLAEYTGQFYSAEVDNVLTIELGQESLWVRGIDGDGDHHLSPVSGDVFRRGKKGAHLVFVKDANNNVSAFIYQGPRVSGIRFERQEK
ncbi:MAG: serine hydrolase domain-containing protein [Parvularculaceae bacterium]